ncbi:helix-turn-helix transcriptional regulator [Pseudomonas japonica]|uniref:helix-turn-helix transcriptional regulator n=1 Tax=Pseudomonas japonica TaxID=256466 RepID=UPI003A8A75DA
MTQKAVNALGKRIKVLRLRKRLTQADLAEALGCEPITVSRYERGVYAPSIEALEQISGLIGCTMDEFFSSNPASEFQTGDDHLRHALCDIAYRTKNSSILMEILEAARVIQSRYSE